MQQDDLLDTMHKFQWDNASTHTKAEARAAKQMRDKVVEYKKNLEVGKADIMGFGAGGYWSQNGKTYGQKNPADAYAYAQGTGGVSDYDKGMAYALGGTAKPNPADAHKYAQGTGGVSDYDKGMQHALGGSEKRDSPKMISEDYDSKREYYNEMISRAADDYLNEWGGKDTAETKDAWAAYGKKVDELVTQRDAYNRAAMGVDTSAVQGGGGGRSVSLSPNDDEPMYVGDAPKPEEGSDEALGSFLDDMFNDGGEWKPGAEGVTDSYIEGMSFFNGTSVTIDNATKYEAEKKKRADTLTYNPSTDFAALLSNGLSVAQNNLVLATNEGDTALIAQYEAEVGLYNAMTDMNVNVDPKNDARYSDMQNGLQAAQDLVGVYQNILDSQQGAARQQTQGTLDLLNDEIIAINNGMNIVGETYLDELDAEYANKTILKPDYIAKYKDYYASVIERESMLEIESTSLGEDNLTMANLATTGDLALLDMLESFDTPLYSTEKDAVLAFKQEAMPLTLDTGNEHSAFLDTIEILNTETGETETYYYYFDVAEGAENNVVANAILGAGGENRKLLHTHPVTGGGSRYFSGDPENQGIFDEEYFVNNPSDGSFQYFMQVFNDITSFNPDLWGGDTGDSNVATTLGYEGIYVITSAGEVKLYEGPGQANIGSGTSTYANTEEELEMLSTINVYQ